MEAMRLLSLRKAQQLIAEACRNSGLSQAELARRCGLQRSVLNAYIHGHRQPGADVLARICAAAGFELDLNKRPMPVDPDRASRLLVQVLDLAEALPFQRSSKLEYPKLLTLKSADKVK